MSDDGLRGRGGETIFARVAGRTGAIWRAAVASALDVALAPVCLACHSRLSGHDCLCPACWTTVEFIRPPVCDRLGLPLPHGSPAGTLSAAAIAHPPDYDRARAVAFYDGAMAKLIHGFKYSDRHDARRLFGRWLASAGSELAAQCDVILPIPLSRWRLIERRFNQSAILAMEVGRRAGRPVAPLALERIKATRSQVGLTALERAQNLSGAFAVPARQRHRIAGQRVLLIDDVLTTGATCNSAARALKAAGASRVDVLALAIAAEAFRGL